MFKPGSKLKPETISRMEREAIESAREKFARCVKLVWESAAPEIYARGVITFGRRAGIL